MTTPDLACGTIQTYTTHVCTARGWEERRRSQGVDSLLPLVAGLLGRVDILDALTIDLVDGVPDPPGLDLDTAGPVGE